MGKLAFITQSYKNDYEECKLLCRSIDKFLDKEISHFIFVNDEDYTLFSHLSDGRRKVYKKSTIMPWYMVRFPFKVMGHHYYISPITIPVREWIVQQICKLGVFEVIGDQYDAVFNVDSESVFMRPITESELRGEGKFFLYRIVKPNEPCQKDYCRAIEKLLGINTDENSISKYNYMCTPVCFERENLTELLNTISRKSIWKNWKLALANTYRFSENYLYGVYTNFALDLKHHYLSDIYRFPLINRNLSKAEMVKILENSLSQKDVMGVLFQKKDRRNLTADYITFDEIQQLVESYWK